VWNLIVLGGGVLAAMLGLFVPMFWVGFTLFLVLNIAIMVVYVVHRNGLVQEEDTVCTPAHFRRMREEGLFGKKKDLKEVKERVRLTGADKKVVPIPDEGEEREQYRLTQDLLFDAFWRRATVVEIVPSGQYAKTVLEVDGVPIEADPMSRADGDAVIQFLKKIAGLSMEERRKPQRGEVVAAVGGENKNKVFVQTDGSTAGEKVSFRIIRGESNFKVPDLGFNPKQLEAVQVAREALNGLVLMSAPSGSGLTTTIYSMTRTHDRFLQNIQTIEYERELPIDNVTQKIYNPSEGKTFAEQLQRLVRSDPDVIVLPELREREAAVIAAQSAANKQKVYVGVIANDIFDALRKWIAMVGNKTLVAKGLLAVCNQRLVRMLCSECKEAYKPDPQMMRKLNLPPDKHLYRPPEPQFDKRGNPIVCQACQGTGYVGRSGVFDWLAVDENLRKVIVQSKSMSEIQNYVLKKGGVGLQAQALAKVLDGRTSIQEVVRAVRGQGNGGTKARSASGAATPRPTPRPKPSSGGAAPATGGGAA
jgi:type II secretory ATPase GspE/PulE/Tfp pilus assembly ATPase PilB-like protein